LTGIFAFALVVCVLMISFNSTGTEVNVFTDNDLKIIVSSLDDEINFGGCTSYNFQSDTISLYCDDVFPITGQQMIIKRISNGILPHTTTPMDLGINFYLKDKTLIKEFPNAIVQ